MSHDLQALLDEDQKYRDGMQEIKQKVNEERDKQVAELNEKIRQLQQKRQHMESEIRKSVGTGQSAEELESEVGDMREEITKKAQAAKDKIKAFVVANI